MARGRITFAAAYVLSILLFLRWDSVLAPMLLASLTALVPISALLLWAASRQISVTMQSLGPAGKGEVCAIEVCAASKGFIPVFGLHLAIRFENPYTGDVGGDEIRLAITSRGSAKATIELKSEHCGNLIVSVERARSIDLLHIFARAFDPPEQTRALILPNTFPIAFMKGPMVMGAGESGQFSADQKGLDANEIFQVREYVPGASMGSIHWKMSAKLDALYIKEPSDPIPDTTLLFLETTWAPGHDLDADRDQGDALLEAAASIAQALFRDGELLTVGYYDGEQDRIRLIPIASEDELAGAELEMLGAHRFVSDKCGFARHFAQEAPQLYTRILFLTDRDGWEQSDDCENIRILLCSDRKAVDGGATVFDPGEPWEALSLMTI